MNLNKEYRSISFMPIIMSIALFIQLFLKLFYNLIAKHKIPIDKWTILDSA